MTLTIEIASESKQSLEAEAKRNGIRVADLAKKTLSKKDLRRRKSVRIKRASKMK